ncbi:zinc ribbon domain-containing protein [Olsenella sp. YH-ols2217]|uniref:Zinc ribbon domain-containing protein n=1 Tax=Kribbibacterium absianum TaxID=3044210 RepID=A0ABT6ZI84_9ACTN|nr:MULTISPECIES: FmdB family zinc ribbon protein [unclassified Olsenella]MDJ1121273.1 zinc ribbon domain-containing protein [Olsenella sp. YH-ols2216]MDJ1128763.1 zinc ribbon domain-containing protein [Olsenella sp. YH-ols2217]
MARYDYRCPACGKVFEVEHPMSERPEICCPADGTVCERVISGSAITFVGSGFYNTDMRDSGETKTTSSESSSSCGGCSGGDCGTCGH